MIKFKVNKTSNAEYPYNVQVLKVYRGREVYSGEGRFCHDMKEVKEYMEYRRNGLLLNESEMMG